MDPCPKCGIAVAAEVDECPACGVILAKARAAPDPRQAKLQTNPYSPPADHSQGAPGGPLGSASAQEITPRTLEALHSARPWLRFVVGYGFVVCSLMLLAAGGMLLLGALSPEMLPLSLIYLVYGGVGFAMLRPLHRSTRALQGLSSGPSDSLETFAVEHGTFWRRAGIISAVSVALMVLALGAVFLLAIFAAASS